MSAIDTTLGREDFPQASGQDLGRLQGVSEKAVARDIKQIKRKAREKVSKEFRQKMIKKLVAKGATRTVSVAVGTTGVGLIITYLIWSFQAIVGNLMGSKIVPKLEWYELIIWAVLGIALAMLLILLIVLAIGVMIMSNPVIAGKLLLESMVNDVMAFFGL